jgi:hypothetical protein
MTNFDYLASLAALFAWRQEKQNGINGVLAAMFVLRNREKAGWGDLSAVIQDAFLSQEEDHPNSTTEFPDVRDPEFQKVLQFSEQIFKDEIMDNLTGGATLFNFSGLIEGRDSKTERTAQVGSTFYFKEIA